MRGRALILAAHGSHHEPEVNRSIEALAERVGARLGFDESVATFHQGTPAFSVVLDRIAASEAVLVPLFASQGYYSDVVLPRELAKNRRHPIVRLLDAPPVGVHPRLAELVLERVLELEAELGLESPAVALVAHGTPRHPRSRRAGEDLVSSLRQARPMEARAFFLDEAPRVEEVREVFPRGDVIVEPFLIAAGGHARHDLARRLGLEERGATEPWVAECGGRRLALDRPLGTDPGIEELVADLARRRLSALAAAGAP